MKKLPIQMLIAILIIVVIVTSIGVFMMMNDDADEKKNGVEIILKYAAFYRPVLDESNLRIAS